MEKGIARSLRYVQLVAGLGIWLAVGEAAFALDYSVPFVRDGLSYSAPDWANGLGAVVGQIEVRSGDGNGIDGFDGSRHAALGAGSVWVQVGATITNLNYGYQDVRDFSGDNNPADSQFHGTFVAGIMANSLGITISTSDTTSVPFTGVAPGAQYYGAIFSGDDTKAGFLSLKQSLDYLMSAGSTLSVDGTQVSGTQVINSSWGSNVSSQAELDGNSATSLLMDEYVGYKGKIGGTRQTAFVERSRPDPEDGNDARFLAGYFHICGLSGERGSDLYAEPPRFRHRQLPVGCPRHHACGSRAGGRVCVGG